jgi:hypothetical protein
MKRTSVCVLILVAVLGQTGHAQPPPGEPVGVGGPGSPTEVTAFDTPNDGGGSITVRWVEPEGAARYYVERAEPDSAFQRVETVRPGNTSFIDEGITDGARVRYRVVAESASGLLAASEPTDLVMSRPQLFNSFLIGLGIGLLIFGGMIAYFIARARKGVELFVRRIAGLEAVDEAVGRATEMGRPLLYIPGTGYIDNISTVASLNLLGEVAKKTAEYGTAIRVPNRDPVVYTVAREVVKGSYTSAGRPDAYDANSVFFLVENALAYAGAVSGLMVRERPAANFFMGYFYGESLILAETGASTGAIQIAGTDATTQLPFFIVACDYTLIGEELYAASAYIAREPLMLGALKGQDWSKFLLMILLILGTAVALVTGVDVGKYLFSTSGY